MWPNNDNVYGAVIMARPLQEFTRFIWWMQTERPVAANPQTEPSDLPVSPKVKAAIIHIHHRHLLVLLSPKADTRFTEGGKLSQPRHCSKGV